MTSTLPRRRGRFMLALPVLTLLLCVLAVVHLGVGARTISPQTVVQALFHFDAKDFDHRIIVSLRLLRMTAAMLVGAALGVAGVLLQALVRNPLGEPAYSGAERRGCFCRCVVHRAWRDGHGHCWRLEAQRHCSRWSSRFLPPDGGG